MAYKVFQNGFPLNASELNNYLMNQSVMVFASTTARDADLTAPVEGMIVWLQDANKFVYYTGSAWADVVTGNGDNAIINGAFDIWQRGTSFVNTSAAWTYTADRWDSGRLTGTSGSTLTRQSSGLTGFNYALRFQRNSGDTATTDQFLVHRLETAMSLPLAGQTVTVSWYARAGANYSPTSSALKLFAYSGTGTDQGGYPSMWTGTSTLVNGESFTLTTSWQRFSKTYTVGSTATQLGFIWQYTGVGTAGANDYYEITGVQLEAGSVATPFKRNAPSIALEGQTAGRYLHATGGTAYEYHAVTNARTTTLVQGVVNLKTSLRTGPSSIEYSNLELFDPITNGHYPVTAMAIDYAGSGAAPVSITATVASGLTSGRTYYLLSANLTNGYLRLPAEL